MAITKSKTYSDCFLYNQYSNYQVVLVDTITNADRIDKTEKIFEDVVYDTLQRMYRIHSEYKLHYNISLPLWYL